MRFSNSEFMGEVTLKRRSEGGGTTLDATSTMVNSQILSDVQILRYFFISASALLFILNSDKMLRPLVGLLVGFILCALGSLLSQ